MLTRRAPKPPRTETLPSKVHNFAFPYLKKRRLSLSLRPFSTSLADRAEVPWSAKMAGEWTPIEGESHKKRVVCFMEDLRICPSPSSISL